MLAPTPKQHSRCIAATVTRGDRGGRVPGDRKAIAFTVASARSLMDRASDYGSEGWKFESSRARQFRSSVPRRLDVGVNITALQLFRWAIV